MANARIAEALRAVASYSTREALIRQKAIAAQFVQHAGDFVRISILSDITREFARKLGAAVVAPSQQSNRPAQQALDDVLPLRSAFVRDHSTVTAIPRTATPLFSRIRFSISSAISGCARRNSRALSLPWPMRSPL